MPHFILDCSSDVITQVPIEVILKEVYYTAARTNLFKLGDIKVRIQPFDHYDVGNERKNFIHVFAHVMEGRTTEQKADLSHRVVSKLKELFPSVPVISMNVVEFEKATYNNLNSI